MPRIKVLPHATICPNGAEFEVEANSNLCQSLLNNGIKIEHACDMSKACTTCHIVLRKGFENIDRRTHGTQEDQEGAGQVHVAEAEQFDSLVKARRH